MYRMLLSILSLFFVTAACAAPKVATSILPIYSLTCAVMENVAEPELLISPKVSPHTYAAKPSDMKKLVEADLIIWVGDSLESNLHEVISKKVGKKKQLQLMHQAGIQLISEDCHCEDHDHGHFDPHIWLSFDNVIAITGIIADRLSALDSENAAVYKKNAKKQVEKLKELKRKTATRLEDVGAVPYMVMHPGYAYFEKEMHLTNLGTIVRNPHAPASLKTINERKQTIIKKGVRCIFAESQIPSDLAFKLSKETNINIATLDPFGSDLLDLKGQAYYTMINHLAESFEKCLTTRK